MEPIYTEELVCLQFRENRYLFSRVEVLRLDGARYQAIHTHGRLGSKGTAHVLLQDGTREAALAVARQKVAERRAEGYLLLKGVVQALDEESRRQARSAAGDRGFPPARDTQPAASADGSRLGLPAPKGAGGDAGSPGTSGDGGSLSPGTQGVLQRLDEIAAAAARGQVDARTAEQLQRFAGYRPVLIRQRTAAVLGRALLAADPDAEFVAVMRDALEALAGDEHLEVRGAALAALEVADRRCCRCQAEINPRMALKIDTWARGDGGWDLDPAFQGYRRLLCIDCQVSLGVFRHRAERTPEGAIRWVPLERDRDA